MPDGRARRCLFQRLKAVVKTLYAAKSEIFLPRRRDFFRKTDRPVRTVGRLSAMTIRGA